MECHHLGNLLILLTRMSTIEKDTLKGRKLNASIVSKPTSLRWCHNIIASVSIHTTEYPWPQHRGNEKCRYLLEWEYTENWYWQGKFWNFLVLMSESWCSSSLWSWFYWIESSLTDRIFHSWIGSLVVYLTARLETAKICAYMWPCLHASSKN